jgi:hypothetical protein
MMNESRGRGEAPGPGGNSKRGARTKVEGVWGTMH